MRLKNGQKYWVVLKPDELFEMKYKDALRVLKRVLRREGCENADDLEGAFVCGIERYGVEYVMTFIPELRA